MSLLAALGLVPPAERAVDRRAPAGPARRARLAIVPRVTRIDGAGQLQLHARARADGHDADVTREVDWTSSDPRVLDVDARGLVSARAVDGRATVRARHAGSGLDDILELEVVHHRDLGSGPPPDLQTLAVQPERARLVRGDSVALRAIGGYSDGASRDVTQAVEWVSSVPAVVDFPAAAAAGAARGRSPGRAEVVARHRGSRVVSRPVPVEVTLPRAAVAAEAPPRLAPWAAALVVLGEGGAADPTGDAAVDALLDATARALAVAGTADATRTWAAVLPKLAERLRKAAAEGADAQALRPAHDALRAIDARVRRG